jgi:4-amino-4-deoxy-L-arabinose transferase-like glycosyltransferase
MQRSIPSHWKIQGILLVLFLLALLLRVAVIAEYGLSTDEVNKMLATRSYKKLDFSANAAHPALMKLAMTLSVMLLGETEFALRLPNVIVSALTIYPLFLLGRKLYDDKTGLLASFLWAVLYTSLRFHFQQRRKKTPF